MSAFRFNNQIQSATETFDQNMDPADSESLHLPLNAQGILVGKHEQMLLEVMDWLQALGSSVSQLGRHFNLLTSQPPAPSSTTPATVSNPPAASSASLCSPPLREPFVPPPEHYSGNMVPVAAFC